MGRIGNLWGKRSWKKKPVVKKKKITEIPFKTMSRGQIVSSGIKKVDPIMVQAERNTYPKYAKKGKKQIGEVNVSFEKEDTSKREVIKKGITKKNQNEFKDKKLDGQKLMNKFINDMSNKQSKTGDKKLKIQLDKIKKNKVWIGNKMMEIFKNGYNTRGGNFGIRPFGTDKLALFISNPKGTPVKFIFNISSKKIVEHLDSTRKWEKE
jgi:hypothetical protein